MTKCLLEDLWATILAFRANYFKLYTCGYLTISVLAVAHNSKYVIVRININYICAHYTLIVSSRSQIRGRLIKIWQQTKKKGKPNGSNFKWRLCEQCDFKKCMHLKPSWVLFGQRQQQCAACMHCGWECCHYNTVEENHTGKGVIWPHSNPSIRH